MTNLDIYEPDTPVRHARTKDLKTYMVRQRSKLPPGTRLYAYTGNSTLHFLLREGRDGPWWKLERQVVGP